MVNELALALALALETPRYRATLQDYNTWLWGMRPGKVQELIDDYETQMLAYLDALPEAVNPWLDLENWPRAGLMAAWADYCKEQGWQDCAFDEVRAARRDRLLASIMREEAEPVATFSGLE